MEGARRFEVLVVSSRKKIGILVVVNTWPWFGIFINLRKAYDTMDRDRCIDICVEAGVGPNAIQLIINF